MELAKEALFTTCYYVYANWGKNPKREWVCFKNSLISCFFGKNHEIYPPAAKGAILRLAACEKTKASFGGLLKYGVGGYVLKISNKIMSCFYHVLSDLPSSYQDFRCDAMVKENELLISMCLLSSKRSVAVIKHFNFILDSSSVGRRRQSSLLSLAPAGWASNFRKKNQFPIASKLLLKFWGSCPCEGRQVVNSQASPMGQNIAGKYSKSDEVGLPERKAYSGQMI